MRRLVSAIVGLLLLAVTGGMVLAQPSFRPLASGGNGESAPTRLTNAMRVLPPTEERAASFQPSAAIGAPSNLRFQPSDVISISQAKNLIFLWDTPTTPPGVIFIYNLSVRLPDGSVETITPQTSNSYMPFITSSWILPGPYIFRLYATVNGVGSSETVEKTLVVQDVAPSPTPVLAVGEPYDLRFEMDGKTLDAVPDVYLKDVAKLWIKWEPPLRPQGVSFTYDIELLFPTGLTVTEIDYTQTAYQPLTAWSASLVNREFVFRIRAKVAGRGESYTVQRSFWVRPDPIVPPTPTPVPKNPDINRDSQTDGNDLMLFALSYRTNVSQAQFEPLADYATDGKIDVHDLLYFYTLYKGKRSQNLTRPVWLYAEVPEMQWNAQKYACEETAKKIIAFPPNEIVFGFPMDETTGGKSQCTYPIFMNSRIYFTEIPGADDYYVTVRDATTGEVFQENITTHGEPSLNYFYTLTINRWYSFEVQPHFPSSGLGEKSEPLLFKLAQ